MTRILVLEEGNDCLFGFGCDLFFVVYFGDEILGLFFEVCLKVFEVIGFSFSLNKEEVFLVSFTKDCVFE